MKMLFRLSIAWGIPVDQLAERLTADALDWYQQFFALEPWGTVADDHRTAIVAYTTAACNSKDPPEFSRFLPQWEPPRRATFAEGMAEFESFATKHNHQLRRANR